MKIEKSKNLDDVGTEVSEFYERLFITRIPVRDKNKTKTDSEPDNRYPDKFETQTGDIKGDAFL
ncbi:hypothetical protein [Ichthyobacterium seriolicida]|uniref:Uncharacterized protein n=1 Tax=Ichthyobacterium seriolicida TaxID=242600 RepID=A0A1J1DWC9_9FLAO|nr:hypothetical protein [Ichthyobacterium seriolicida]BAV94169.1 hypothetical protein JBKA6_0156 [Ichthyobacterium seriolicida]